MMETDKKEKKNKQTTKHTHTYTREWTTKTNPSKVCPLDTI